MGSILSPKIPKAPDPVRVPTPNDPDIKAGARKRRVEDEEKRKGRGATNLSGGGQSYTRTTLG